MTCVYPGDLVYVWRVANNKKEGPRQIQRGKFLGPCRVLATETRVDPKENLTAGSVVWLYRGGSLIKAAPQQLRPATAREEALSEICNPVSIPWTIADTLVHRPPHLYEDITGEAAQMPQNVEVEEDTQNGPQRRLSRVTPLNARPTEVSYW